MKKNIYKLLLSAKQILFALTVLSGTVYSQTTYTFNYTGSAQSISLPAGTYSIQSWGANGGTSNGGRGGYATGTINITAPATYYVYVGGVGTTMNTTGSGNALGGWNGGGNGSCYNSYGTSGGGGGGSDVRTSLNTTYANRIIVAGGGGGGSVPGTYGYLGGVGGGITGGNGTNFGNYWAGQGGTQTSGGAGTTESNSIVGAGALGVGGNHSSTAAGSGWVGCGGGGGYYGGSAGGAVHSGGGGGSGYVGGVSSAINVAFGQTGFVANPVTTGDGLVLIRELCNINLLANGVSTSTTICAGTTISLTTNAISNYSWSTGATTSSLLVTPMATTVYTLGAVSPSNCTSSAQLTVIVNSGLPTLTVANTASATSGVCPGNTVMLTASGANTYTWNGGTSVTNGVAFAITSVSGFTVTGQNACGTSSVATSLSIHPVPTVGAVASQPTLCSGTLLTLTGTGASSYTWYPLSLGITNGVSFMPSVSLTYTVVGGSALGCTSTAQSVVNVTTTPNLAPVMSTVSICNGNSATITASGATSYSWNTGATTNSIVVNPSATTSYTIIKWNANCFDTKITTLTVNPLPVVFALTNDDTVCASTQATLTTGGGVSYTWVPGGTTPTQYTTVVSPSVVTIYTVTAFDGLCTNIGTVQVATNPNPTLTVAASTSVVCLGKSAAINISGATTYTWVQPNLSGSSIIVSPTSATLYQVTGYNSYSCSAQASQIVLVNQLPVLNTNMTRTLVCSGFPSTLLAVGQHTYSWGHGPTTATTIVNPVSTTIYTVTLTNTVTTCSSTRTMQVGVFSPNFVTTKDTALCNGGSIILNASGANSYTWTGFPPNQPNIQISPNVPTVYTVTANSASPGNYVSCLSTKMVTVTIYANPTVTAVSQKTLICRNDFVNLTASGANTYVWANNVGTGGTVAVAPLVQTIYTVTGTDIFGCVHTTTVIQRVSTCPGFSEHSMEANLFSVYPNPNNGNFVVRAESFMQLNLVNELGQVLRPLVLDSNNHFTTELNGLSAGIYFIAGTNGDKNVYQKVIVTR